MKTTKRKRYRVVDVVMSLEREIGRFASITSALVRAYKYGRRTNREMAIYRGKKWLATVLTD